jgi:peroxiredoxin
MKQHRLIQRRKAVEVCGKIDRDFRVPAEQIEDRPMAANTLRQRLADLHAERVRTWDPAVLQVNIDQRLRLVGTSNYDAFVKPGDKVAPFVVEEVGGEALSLDGLLRAGPVVLIFFRFAGCPACNIALPYYNEALQPGLKALGASLVALSPQIPDRLEAIKSRHGLDFWVATDHDNLLGKRFGIVFEPDEASKSAAIAKGNFIGDTTGTGTWELPMPAAIVIDQEGVVRLAEVSPDWLVRAEAEPILEAVDALMRPSARIAAVA